MNKIKAAIKLRHNLRAAINTAVANGLTPYDIARTLADAARAQLRLAKEREGDQK